MGGVLAVLTAWWGRGAIESSEAHAARMGDQVATQAARIVELADGLAAERERADAERQQGAKHAAALNEQLRQASSQADVMASQLDRAMGDLEHARAERDAAEAIQAATTATWAAPAAGDVMVEQQGDGDEPTPGG